MKRPSYPSDKQDQYMLRLPPGMREQIKRSAEESGRSMNAEIVDALREFFPADPGLDELISSLEFSISMLRTIEGSLEETGRYPAGEIGKVLAEVQSVNDGLYKFMGRERISPVAMLTQDAVVGVDRLLKSYEFPVTMFEDMISNLVLMSVDRVMRKEERLKVRIGEGAAQRVVEIQFPDEENGDE